VLSVRVPVVPWVARHCDFVSRQLAVKKFRFTKYLFLLASSTLVPAADTVVNRLQKMDRDGDGQLSREEAPKSIRKFKFDLADRNKDGFL
ncbi:uncharacterized protein METZ01_LOCUS97494, partial [marine metagenome]